MCHCSPGRSRNLPSFLNSPLPFEAGNSVVPKITLKNKSTVSKWASRIVSPFVPTQSHMNFASTLRWNYQHGETQLRNPLQGAPSGMPLIQRLQEAEACVLIICCFSLQLLCQCCTAVFLWKQGRQKRRKTLFIRLLDWWVIAFQ
jgi:hypothetical protein